jgi:hypothetical protein
MEVVRRQTVFKSCSTDPLRVLWPIALLSTIATGLAFGVGVLTVGVAVLSGVWYAPLSSAWFDANNIGIAKYWPP